MLQFYLKTRLPHKTFTFSAHPTYKICSKCGHSTRSATSLLTKPSQDAIDKKSSLCRRVSEAAKNHLSVDITGISLFDAIDQLRPSTPSASKPKTFLTKGETSFKFT